MKFKQNKVLAFLFVVLSDLLWLLIAGLMLFLSFFFFGILLYYSLQAFGLPIETTLNILNLFYLGGLLFGIPILALLLFQKMATR